MVLQGYTRVCSSGTKACLHQQVLRICSAMCVATFIRGLVLTFFTVLDVHFTDDGQSQVRKVEKFYYFK